MDGANSHILSNGSTATPTVTQRKLFTIQRRQATFSDLESRFFKKCQRANKNVFYAAKGSRAQVTAETLSVQELRAMGSLGEAGRGWAGARSVDGQPGEHPSARSRPSPRSNLQPRCCPSRLPDAGDRGPSIMKT